VCQGGIFHLTQTDIWDKFTPPFFLSPSHGHMVQGPRLEENVALQQQPRRFCCHLAATGNEGTASLPGPRNKGKSSQFKSSRFYASIGHGTSSGQHATLCSTQPIRTQPYARRDRHEK